MKTRITALLIVLIVLNGWAQNYKPVGDRILTKWAQEVTPENVWQEYPRPQLTRENWINLNGLWEYALLEKNESQPKRYQGDILVPFCIESALSGVGKSMTPDERLWYKKEFELPGDWQTSRILLNFDAVDWSSSVWINGAYVGAHKGAYDRFTFDITDFLKGDGKEEIVVAVDDPISSGSQARGKQRLSQGGIWYTPVSGIWQTVWLEPVNKEASLTEVKITPDIDNNLVTVLPMLYEPLPKGYKVKVTVFDENQTVAEAEVEADKKVDIPINNPKLWSPDSPFLYELKLKLYNPDGKELDEVNSYFGMRKISLQMQLLNQVLCLNDEPLFHYGTLDQGWWPDGLHTPPSDEAMKYDIEMTKKMGFNMIRKHIKVENDRWFYHCDKLGIMVWQDMPSGMVVIPREDGRPVSVQSIRFSEEDINRRSEAAAQFEWELRRMIDLHYNVPSIVMWIPFNEGWGQYSTCRIVNGIENLDPTRLVNAASGWGIRPCGDIFDLHSYGEDIRVPPTSREKASVLGEMGGIGYPVEGHLWNPEMRNWGYQNYQSEKELLDAYKHKFEQLVEMKQSKGLSAAVYTQTTDVEGEVNGLMTYDRKVVKIPVETLTEMHSVLYEPNENGRGR
ncbi:glycoside hydrolase family 2 [Maribellus comscasis]|uniref:Glycoside hydrolase family 2 n=1 Tax=Maribellus comscasis TaxID=2681766 RepID=A0A6I6K4J2_9BACT|nr:sugar-binding domain-containing protein [Maribellus comscasis]QGY47567.1 glycoside hydrolase family 2 [Maribellus comscasis]